MKRGSDNDGNAPSWESSLFLVMRMITTELITTDNHHYGDGKTNQNHRADLDARTSPDAIKLARQVFQGQVAVLDARGG